jgi:hypothetical protein
MSKISHDVDEEQDTERGRRFTRPETTTPAFERTNAGV